MICRSGINVLIIEGKVTAGENVRTTVGQLSSNTLARLRQTLTMNERYLARIFPPRRCWIAG